ncbi:hypothetical protein BS78_01G094500 [Paspalum vaginatum]|nr:hypothetical protein BS78_01G094500 [Paspalum vaginatum]
MSRRTMQPAAASRRTRRAEKPRPPAAESPKIVSNPIFRYEAGPGPSQPGPPAGGDRLRCVYGPNSLYALVHDPASAAGSGVGNNGKALPLPPCRAHPSSGRMGPARAARGPHGGVLLRRAPHDRDPFLAAYVACSKSAGGTGKDAAAEVDRRQQQQAEKKRGKKKTTAKRKCKGGEGILRGCGVWSGWAAGAKYAGALSCRYYGCAVVAAKKGDPPATPTKVEAGNDKPEGPTLDLSWAPAVVSARALERRQQR